MFKCFLFDFDGTLFDSAEANIASYAEAFQAEGLHFDESKYRHAFGLRFPEMMDRLAPNTDESTRKRIKERKAEAYKENLSLVKPNERLISFLRLIRPSYYTALVTTASRVNVENVLTHYDISADLFDVIITGENVTHGKPHMECYKKAIDAIDVDPSACVIFEDSDIGVEAAKAAGGEVVRIKI